MSDRVSKTVAAIAMVTAVESTGCATINGLLADGKGFFNGVTAKIPNIPGFSDLKSPLATPTAEDLVIQNPGQVSPICEDPGAKMTSIPYTNNGVITFHVRCSNGSNVVASGKKVSINREASETAQLSCSEMVIGGVDQVGAPGVSYNTQTGSHNAHITFAKCAPKSSSVPFKGAPGASIRPSVGEKLISK